MGGWSYHGAEMRIVRLMAAAGFAMACAAGCHAPTPPKEPTEASVGRGADINEMWDDALHTLRKFGFQPDLQDRAHRLIVTKPETSGQWFEFWRRDLADDYSRLEASLHTVRRRVTVRFTQVAGGGWQCNVRVDVLRVSSPERQATTASAALHIFSSRSPTNEGEVLFAPHAGERSYELGRDPAMERKILNRIMPAAMREVAMAGK